MQHTLYTLFLLVFFMACNSAGNTGPCYEGRTGSFFPTEPGDELRYQSNSGPFTAYFTGDSIEHEGVYYYRSMKVFDHQDDIEEHWRTDEDGVHFYDPQEGSVSTYISGDLSIGNSWDPHGRGSWEHEVVDTQATLETPECTFDNLLQVEARPQGMAREQRASHYSLYYKRGVGLVGLTIEGELSTYLLPRE